MELDLKGKAVLVTGGSKGIGLACAQAFAAEGARVCISSRSQGNIDQALASMAGALGLAADLTDAEQALAMVEGAERALGGIDILVNSAGAARRTPPDELTPALWRAAIDAKFFAYINVIDPVIKRMAQRRAGVVVNIIGNGGKVASATHLAGGAANAALMLATTGLANAYASRGIRVVGLNPGATETGRVAEGLKADARLAGITEEEARERSIKRIAMGRMASPRELAETVTFLASPRASYVTGVNITMDGGTSAVVV